MSWFWTFAIRPLLLALQARTIVEIGAARGTTTVPLLELAEERNAVVHVIDPAPRFDVAALKARFDRHLRLHIAKSVDALEAVGAVDAALIDGDHNWYTVHRELTALESLSRRNERPFPLVMLHDVAWPYARRDMYHSPEDVPERWRQPWAHRPIVWGQSALGDGPGPNAEFANALVEGTPRNGVLTAIEDFRDQSDVPLELYLLQGRAGLGVLVPTATLDAIPTMRRQWDRLHTVEFLQEHTKRLAEMATRTEIARRELERELDRLPNADHTGRGNAA